MIKIVFLMSTNMSGVPEGTLSPSCPSKVDDVRFCETNLTSLPVNLFVRWPVMFYFALKLSPDIMEFPPVMLRGDSALPWVSIGSNVIVELPENVCENLGSCFIHVEGNPLKRLPDNVCMASSIWMLSVAFTHMNIPEIPHSWMGASSKLQKLPRASVA